MMRAMPKSEPIPTTESPSTQGSSATKVLADSAIEQPVVPTTNLKIREIGGRDGPEPTRFGDWEKSGRCIDF
jgi:hypothetical protein